MLAFAPGKAGIGEDGTKIGLLIRCLSCKHTHVYVPPPEQQAVLAMVKCPSPRQGNKAVLAMANENTRLAEYSTRLTGNAAGRRKDLLFSIREPGEGHFEELGAAAGH